MPPLRCYPAFFWKANCKVVIGNLLVVKCERWGTPHRKWAVLSLHLHAFFPQGDSGGHSSVIGYSKGLHHGVVTLCLS